MPPTLKELRQLQEKYQAEGLDTSGDRYDLAARLAGHLNRHTKMLTPESPEGSGNIQSSPGDVEHVAEASHELAGSTLVDDGLPGFDSFKRLMVNLDRSLAAIDIEQANISYLLDNLATAMPGYNGRRNCFLSTFKRDKLGCATPEDLRVIEEEQLVAHGGDARSDAALYGAPDGRTDVKIFEKLYGILPATIERISCIKTIAALDIHAGVVTSNSKTGSDKFYQLFWEFVRLLKEPGLAYHEGYLDNEPADLVNAYHAFMGCIKTEVTLIAA